MCYVECVLSELKISTTQLCTISEVLFVCIVLFFGAKLEFGGTVVTGDLHIAEISADATHEVSTFCLFFTALLKLEFKMYVDYFVIE